MLITTAAGIQSQPSIPVTMYCAGYPNAPASPILQQGSKDIIIVSWTLPTSDGGSPVLGFKLYMKSQTDAQYTLVYDGGEDPNTFTYQTTTDASGNPLIPMTNYLFMLTARNIVGTSPSSNPLTVAIPYLLSAS
jgi:hypothetical protein